MISRWLAALFIIASLTVPAAAFANSAETVPEGIFVIGVKGGAKWADDHFGSSFSHKRESIVEDYNITLTGADLDPNMFTTKDIIGTLDASYNGLGAEISITAAYGITDNIALMMIIPVQYAHAEYSFELNDSNMYMVRDSQNNPYAVANKEQIETIWSGSTFSVADKPLDADDLKEVLTCRADTPLCQFRYNKIKDISRWGVNDIITGLRYKFFESKRWRQSFTLFNKWGTGKHKNYDDIFDVNFGDQQIDIGFWYGVDFTPIKPLVFNVSFGYTDQLPETKVMRIKTRTYNEKGEEVGTIPLVPAANKMRVHRDIGGNWDLYFGFTWNITDYISYGNEFYFFWKYEDNFWAAETIPDSFGGLEPDWRAMEWGTNQAALQMTNMLSFTTLPWVMSGDFPVPLMLGVGYTIGIAGQHFDRDQTIFASLDLIGSIYMLEDAKEEKEEAKEKEQDQLNDFQLPGNAYLEAVDEDALAESEKKARRYKQAQDFQKSWGKVTKLRW